MTTLYQGVWPKNVNKTAKYAIRLVPEDNSKEYRVTVQCDIDDELRYLAVDESKNPEDQKITLQLIKAVNSLKVKLSGQPGGVFYVNEYLHVIVPVKERGSSNYYYIGKLPRPTFRFQFEGKVLSGEARGMKFGDCWTGPRPGVPYVLKAGGHDIEFKAPAFTDDEVPRVRQNQTRKVKLSKVLQNPAKLARTVEPIRSIIGHTGGRFYVNEYGSIFTPRMDQETGIDYKYCGRINLENWFPEPMTPQLIQDQYFLETSKQTLTLG